MAARRLAEPDAGPATGTGIVRPPRRPTGWCAPGPPLPAPPYRPELWPRAGEDLCYLAGDWRILQRLDGHRWSLDDLVTAWFAATQARAALPKRIADLGCGIGAVLLLLAWCFPGARCVGVEAQAESVGLACRSLGWNGVENRCEIRRGDLRDPLAFPEGATFDLVTGTPPYLRPGTATAPRSQQRAASHLTFRGGIEEYSLAAARIMRPHARFVACAGAAETSRVTEAAERAGLRIERRLDVIPREGKRPLFAVYAMAHGSEVGASCGEPPLVVRDRERRRTDAFRRLRETMGMPP